MEIDAKLLSVPEILDDALRFMVSGDVHVSDPGRPDLVDDVLQERTSAHGQHRLGQLVGQRLEP